MLGQAAASAVTFCAFKYFSFGFGAFVSSSEKIELVDFECTYLS
jgi:hypothetical protein